MIVDWLIYGAVVYGLAAALNHTVFKQNGAATSAVWALTIVIFFVNIFALTALKHLRYEAISAEIGVPIKASNPLDMGGAFVFAWLFFSFIKRKPTGGKI